MGRKGKGKNRREGVRWKKDSVCGKSFREEVVRLRR